MNAAWLGAVLAMLVLVATAHVGNDLSALTLNDVAVWSSLLVLLTSLGFALFTPWGFLRFRWVSIKWTALASLALVGMFARTPAINTLAAHADLVGAPGDRTAALAWLIGEAIALLSVFALSVWKPFGRTAHAMEPGPKLRAVLGVAVLTTAAFAIVQSASLAALRRTPIASVDVAALRDGVYVGDADVGVHARTRIVVARGRIETVDVIDLPGGVYADLARGVARRIVVEQRIDVDGVSGATTTSRAIQKSAESALQAGETGRNR